MSKFLLIADAHIKTRTWQNFPDLAGDSYAALRYLADDLKAKNELPDTLVIAGDWFDSNRPSSMDLYETAQFLSLFKDIFYISGNHDSVRPSWLSSLGLAFNKSSQLIGDNFCATLDNAIVLGVAWNQDKEAVKAEVSDMLKQLAYEMNLSDANNGAIRQIYLVLHGASQHLLNFEGSYYFDHDFFATLLPANLTIPVTVLVGDIHKRDTRQFANLVIHSPGSLYPTNWSEVEGFHGASLIDPLASSPIASIKAVPIKVRAYKEIETQTREQALTDCLNFLQEANADPKNLLYPCARVDVSKWQDKSPFKVPGLCLQFVDTATEEVLDNVGITHPSDEITIQQAVEDELSDETEKLFAIDFMAAADPKQLVNQWLSDHGVKEV